MTGSLGKRKFKSIQEQVYNSLLKSIVDLELPPGTKLTIDRLQQIYGVSSTPIRGALFQLQQDSLLTSGPGKSFYVAGISKQDVHNLFEIRIALETTALKQSINRISDELMSELIVRMKSHLKNPEETKKYPPYDIDYKLHKEIIVKSENTYLISIIKRISMLITRMRNVIRYYLPEQQKDWIIYEMEEHLLIAESIFKKELEKSLTYLKAHLEHSENIICSILSSAEIKYKIAPLFSSLMEVIR